LANLAKKSFSTATHVDRNDLAYVGASAIPGQSSTIALGRFVLATEILPSRSTLPVRILVVDDYEPWRGFLRSMLEMHSQLQIVGEAADGLEAVQQAAELKPDVVLLDIGLPNLNGIEAARHIRNVAPHAKMLFLTQNNIPALAKAALANGARAYLLKPDASSELVPAIEAVLRGEKFLSERLRS